MEELLALLGLGGGGLLVGDAYDTLGSIGQQAWTESQNIGQTGADMADFTGFGVTGPTGTGAVDEFGNTALNLSPEQANLQQLFESLTASTAGADNPLATFGSSSLATAESMLGNLGDPAAMQQEMYDAIRAMQIPEEQRQQDSLEASLAAQGRTGVSTAAFGGTPEQLAHDKAVQEAMNAAAYEAIGLSQNQQTIDTNTIGMLGDTGASSLGTQGDLSALYGQLQYAPQAALLDMFNAGTSAYGYEDIGDRQGATLFTDASMGGLEALLGSALGQANLQGTLGSGLITGGMGMLGSAVNSGTGNIGDLIDEIFGAFTI